VLESAQQRRLRLTVKLKEFRKRFNIPEGTRLSSLRKNSKTPLPSVAAQNRRFGADQLADRFPQTASSDWRRMRGAFKGPSLIAARRQERRDELKSEVKRG
jgi:hypothetical protein